MIFLRRAPTNVTSLSLAANTLSNVTDLLGTRTGTFTLVIRSSFPVYILFDSDTTMDNPQTAGFRIGPGVHQFAVSRATRYMRFYGNDTNPATIHWYLFAGVPIYETIVKPPVLVTTLAVTAGGTTPASIFSAAGAVDMVCQANAVSYILFGSSADMPLATATTGFPIDSESVCFTIAPPQRFMSVGGSGALLMYYFSGQTEPSA